MEAAAQERFDALRNAHFPPSRNFLAAHITLFHALPSSQRSTINAQLEQIAHETPQIRAEVTGLRFLGRGVAYQLEAAHLRTLHEALAVQWEPWLTNQDRARFRAHITVQNKVSAATARETLALLETDFQPWSFALTGLTLWRYLGGPWQRLSEYAFQMPE
jgi:2'-5' RNA ligase